MLCVYNGLLGWLYLKKMAKPLLKKNRNNPNRSYNCDNFFTIANKQSKTGLLFKNLKPQIRILADQERETLVLR